jgi:hypothetical protein
VEVPKKTTQAPSIVKRGRVAQTKKDNAPNKHLRKEKMRPLQKIVNVSQPVVDRHLVDIPQSSAQVRYRNENASMSKNPDALIFENHMLRGSRLTSYSNVKSTKVVCIP